MVISTATTVISKLHNGNSGINTDTQTMEFFEIKSDKHKERIIGSRIAFTIETLKEALEKKQFI
jgi:hypothetical protein